MPKDTFKLNQKVLNDTCFNTFDDLTIHDAAFWMVVGTDPLLHEQRCEVDSEYLQNYCNHPNAQDYVLEICGRIQSAIYGESIKPTRGAEINSNHLDIHTTHISKASWLKWCENKGYIERNELAPKSKISQEEKDYLIDNPNDPEPILAWYTPARYFARQLVKEDPTLLTKTSILANKVVQSLNRVGVFKRGGKKPFCAETIKKAFSNVKF